MERLGSRLLALLLVGLAASAVYAQTTVAGGNLTQGSTYSTLAVAWTNSTAASVDVDTITITLDPAFALGATALAGAGWTCTVSGQIVSCTASSTITVQPAAATPSVTLDFQVPSTAALGTHTIAVDAISAPGATTTYNYTVVAVPQIGAALQYLIPPGGNNSVANLTVTVSNLNQDTLTGTFTFTATLPTGFSFNGTYTSSNNALWSCSPGGTSVTTTCSTIASTVLAPTTTLLLTLQVVVGSSAANSTMTATVTASVDDGDGIVQPVAAAPASVSAVVSASALMVNLTHQVTGSSTTGGSVPVGVPFAVLVQVSAAAGTYGEALEFTTALDPSLTINGTPSGTGWTCAVASGQATCGTATSSAGTAPSVGQVTIPVIANTSATGTTITNTVNATLAFFNGSVSPGSDKSTATDSMTLFTAAQFGITVNHIATGGATGDPILAGGTGTINILTNNGGSTAFIGQLTVTDAIPATLTVGALAATQGPWSCSAASTGTGGGQTVTCTATFTAANAVSPGAVLNAISIPFSVPASDAPQTVVNSAGIAVTVLGGGTSSAASAPDSIIIPAPASISLTATHTPTGGAAGGSVPAGTGGVLTVTVTNKGASPITSGSITVTDQLTQFLTLGSLTLSQAPFSCTASALPASGSTVTCVAPLSATSTLAAGASVVISIPFAVPSSAAIGAIQTTAGLTYAPTNGAAVTTTVNDTIQVIGPPPLTLTATHTVGTTVGGPVAPGGTGVLTLTPANGGATAITAGTLTVIDQLTQYLTLGTLAATQGPWTCSSSGTQATGQTVTCTTTATAANPVPANAALPAITIPFSVPSNAAGGSITTTAQFSLAATGVSPAPVIATDTIQVVVPPQITITATHTPASIAAGSSGSITLTATNSSTGALSGTFTITDALPTTLLVGTGLAASQGPWTCALGTPTASATPVICTAAVASANAIPANTALASVTIPFSVVATTPVGSVTNSVTASFAGANGTATATTTDSIAVTGAPAVMITETHSPSSVAVGGSGTITLTVSNAGTSAISGSVQVVGQVDTSLTIGALTASQPPWVCSSLIQTVTCNATVSSLAAGGSLAPISIPFSIASAVTATKATNTVAATFTPTGGTQTTATASDAIPIQAASSATIGITLTHTPSSGAVGGAVTPGGSGVININATNTGSSAITGSFTVTDALNTNLTLGALTKSQTPWSCSSPGQTVTCTAAVASLAAGASVGPITIPFTVSATAPAGSITNSAGVTFTPQTGTSTSPSASDTISIQAAPSLNLNLTTTATSLQAGSTATFTAVINNASGPAVTANSVTLTVQIDSSLSFSSSPSGSGWTCPQTATGQTVTCTLSNGLAAAPSSSSLTIPVFVSGQATGQSTVAVSLNGAGSPVQQSKSVAVNPLAITLTAPSSGASEGQPTVTLASQVASTVNGCLVLTFAPGSNVAAPVDDPTVALALSNPFFTAAGTTSRAATFTLAPGSAISQNVTVSLGSTAGTVTLSAYALAPGATCPVAEGATPVATSQISMATAAPVVQNVSLTRSGDTLTVMVTGFSNTRDASSASFTFTAASGATIQNGNTTLTTNISSLATPYFASVTGGAFVYTQNFNLTAPASDIASVAVTLTNSAGQSSPTTGN